MLLDQPPDSRAYRIKAEIDARSQIENDRLAIELSKDNVVAHPQRRIQ